MQATAVSTGLKPPTVSVEITFVDTAPVEGQGLEIDGIQYHRTGALIKSWTKTWLITKRYSTTCLPGPISHQGQNASLDAHDATITFHCPHHGPHIICVSDPADVARLEANAAVRNLIRAMIYLLDANAHHVRITGADYAGVYQEVFLYRSLAVWSATASIAAGRTPHILHAPLIVD